ncbi:MAG TPA: SigE family RNA polymerase sigma factor [Mycobacteriales bacterium]
MRSHDESIFREYVAGGMQSWRRMAYLLCHDWHTADDLVSVTCGKLYQHWSRVRTLGNIDAYVRRMLLNAWLDERRRPWRRERPIGEVPDWPAPQVADRTEQGDVIRLLDELPPRRRAAIVLRYYCDLSVEETAEALGVSSGTVKSLTSRGLLTLRTQLTSAPTA